MSLLREIHANVPKEKHVSDWYVDLHNAVSHVEKQLSAARAAINKVSDPHAKKLQAEIIRLQKLAGRLEDDIEELGPEAFAKWDKK